MLDRNRANQALHPASFANSLQCLPWQLEQRKLTLN